MSFNEDIAHIVYASDDKFSEILGVSLVSLFENSKEMEDIIVYILDNGISELNKSKLTSVCKKYGRHLPIWIKAKDIRKELKIEVAVDRGSISQYARLFISSNLPKELSRVLYLDCDIIINKSIRELWNLNLQGKTIAALKDAFSKYYRINIDLKSNDIMFNSGVMLIDMELWNQQTIEEKLLKFIVSKKGKIQQGDQGVLNYVLSADTFCFEPRFNAVTIFYDFSYKEMMIYRKAIDFYSNLEIDQAIKQPSIIHFTTSFKSLRPWVKGSRHKYVNEWLEYKALSPWKDEPLWEDTRPKLKQIVNKIYIVLPKCVSLHFAGLVQAYGRPFINRLKAIKE